MVSLCIAFVFVSLSERCCGSALESEGTGEKKRVFLNDDDVVNMKSIIIGLPGGRKKDQAQCQSSHLKIKRSR